ncbi:MAG: DUF1499 domain-containing protein [Trueperaceae bacterium]
MRVLLGILITFALLFIAARVYVAFGVPIPTNLGVEDGQLASCPDQPNCVSTQAPSSDAEHYMAALPYTSDASFTMTEILRVVAAMPRVTIITQEANYLHVEFRSLTMGFVDDAEFYIDDVNKLVHFRSAARLGQSDMGVNRKRMTEITDALKTTL